MDPENKYHRRSVRREGYDYRDGGMYYVTICADKRECIFGDIQNGVIGLNEWGSVVAECWMQIPKHFQGTKIDEFIIMPNHMHGILYLDDPKYRGLQLPDRRGVACYAPTSTSTSYAPTSAPTDENEHIIGPAAGSLGAIIRSFKSAATKRINELRNAQGEPIWQRNYYEHIIRSPDELDRIRSYIMHNPRNWLHDDEYID